jgi:hypothetical protein
VNQDYIEKVCKYVHWSFNIYCSDIWCWCRLAITRRVSLVELELLTFPRQPFCAQFLVFWTVVSLSCDFSFRHDIFCPSIYGFWLLCCYIPTFLLIMYWMMVNVPTIQSHGDPSDGYDDLSRLRGLWGYNMDSPGRTIEASVWKVQHSQNSRDLLYISRGGGIAPQPLQKTKCLVSTKLAILFQWQ